MSSPSDYTVGWICALTIEGVAAMAFLDQKLEAPAFQAKNDANNYKYGKVKDHNVVIAVLPKGEYGNSPATRVANDLRRSFPNIRIGLLVGIGGGAPSTKHDIRLGDVVVSIPKGGQSGVFQYDYGQAIQDENFKLTRILDQPPQLLRTAVASLEIDHMMDGNGLESMITEVLDKNPRLMDQFGRPPNSTDILFQPTVKHSKGDTCKLCKPTPNNVIERKPRKNEKLLVHFGTIASADTLVRDALFRDNLASKYDVLCFEMEAAGLMNGFPCLVIRGICDYADSHKNDLWQGYAAMAAAAYAKQLTSLIRHEELAQETKLSELQTQINKIARTAEDVRSQQEKEEQFEILSWLSQADFGQQQSETLRMWQQGTLQWLLESHEYQKWIREKGEILFCPGIPGAGKTVAISAVIQDLTQRFSGGTDIGLAFIYCSYTQRHNQHTIGLLASILKQLCQFRNVIPDDLKELYIEHRKQNTTPQYKQILRVLKSQFGFYSRVMVVVDALDEWQRPPDDAFNLLDELLSLHNESHINLFVTSRFVPTISNRFQNYPSLPILASQSDISQYISNYNWPSSSLVYENPGLQEQIKSYISQGSKGMFLLAQFYLRSLEDKTTPKELTDALKLYQDRADRKENDQNFDMLAEAYDEVMVRINRQNANFKRRAHQILSWVCYAEQQLYVKELQAAIAVKENQVEVDELDLCPINLLLSACCGIVVISEASETIQLVHYTAQDYFLDRKGQWFPHGQSYLAKQCINYLSLQKFQDKLPDTTDLVRLWTDDPLDRIALFEYAARNWGHHVRNTEDIPKATPPDGDAEVSRTTISVSEVDQAVLNFLRCKDKISRALSIQLHITQDRDLVEEDFEVNALHMAAFSGLDRVIPPVLTGVEINSQDGDGRTALGWASKAGWITTVHLLLSLNSDVDALDFYGHTPLFEATRPNHFEIANVLIERGADINVVAFNGNTALHYAAESNRGKIAHLLLNKGAKFDISNKFGQVPINIAVWNGSRSVYERLFKMGVNPRSCGVDGRTILMEAAGANDEVLVEELLKQGVNVNSQDHRNRTALMEACGAWNQKKNQKIVDMLLQHGANLDIQDWKGQTALMKASRGGNETITALLLKEGANQDLVDHDGCTTLMHACQLGGNGRIINLLLQDGADSEAVDHSGLTALEYAMIGLDELSVKLLLEHGGHTDVVAHLYKGEPPKLSDHGAALFEAFEEGCTSEILELLMERGQSKSPGWHNGLPFLEALKGGHGKLIPLMRDSGVDLSNSYCLVPISKTLVKTITGYDPLDIDTGVLPSFPTGKHPLIVQAGYQKDIRMTALNLIPLQIDSLMQGSLIVPFVDVTKDGQTPIGVPVNFYIGGTNGQPLQAIVPSVASGVSPFEGTTIFPATFSPDTSAARALPNGFNSIQVKPFLLPNTISGPGIYAEAFDISFKTTDSSPYTAHTFHSLLNIPQLLNTNKCQRNTVYFNESSSEPQMAVGEVTLYHQILGTPPQGLEGVYRDVYCYSANGQVVSSLGEPCKVAAANMDPEAKV
ncbi:hypothetical protein IWW34DRAFT_839505 [Fusarium oxysporum f. sp. albedinis]|nr:hypothetical protein IWW34DRAFT_839505 [Fusarium oxysporum f. sp. albedinis]